MEEVEETGKKTIEAEKDNEEIKNDVGTGSLKVKKKGREGSKEVTEKEKEKERLELKMKKRRW